LGSRSGVHVDAFESHFWMLLLRGTKRWVFLDRAQAQRPLLYEVRRPWRPLWRSF
jgi:hypothetical protein